MNDSPMLFSSDCGPVTISANQRTTTLAPITFQSQTGSLTVSGYENIWGFTLGAAPGVLRSTDTESISGFATATVSVSGPYSLEYQTIEPTNPKKLTYSIPIEENKINAIRRREFEESEMPQLRSLIREEPFEPGVFSRADLLVKEMLSRNSFVAKECLESLFLSGIKSGNYDIACGVLNIVARLDESEMDPQGKIMTIAGLKCRNTAVQEAAIRAVENWSSKDAAAILQHIELNSDWLKEYAERVIAGIEAA